MEFLIASASPDVKTAALVIIVAFGAGLAGGLFVYFKKIKNKK